MGRAASHQPCHSARRTGRRSRWRSRRPRASAEVRGEEEELREADEAARHRPRVALLFVVGAKRGRELEVVGETDDPVVVVVRVAAVSAEIAVGVVLCRVQIVGAVVRGVHHAVAVAVDRRGASERWRAPQHESHGGRE